MADGLAQEAQRSLTIPLGSQKVVYRDAGLVDGLIQVISDPLIPLILPHPFAD